MTEAFAVGQSVQTTLGKGVVLEVRNNGRLLVDIKGRSLVFEARGVQRLADEARSPRRPSAAAAVHAPGPAAGPARIREIDLHGLTVEAALARVDDLLDRCMRDDVAQLRVIHGRSGGRLKAALHRRLANIPSVRAFALDPHNAGVTAVFL